MILIYFGLLIVVAGIAMVFGPGAGVIALGVVVVGAGVERDLLTPDPDSQPDPDAEVVE